VVGFLGELSLGHAGFMYVGAYAGGLFSHYTAEIFTSDLLRLILAMLVGGVVAAIFGFLVGLPALRLRGDYLAIVTLAFGEIVRGVLKNIKIEGYIKNPADGFTLPRFKGLFIVALIMVLITIFCIQNLVNSKHGRAITAIRDNEIAARSMGINITFYKLCVFVFSAFFAGVAGAIYSNYSAVIYSSFSYNYSIEILVMVVLGGMGSLSGSLISSLLIVFINVKLQAYLTGDLAGAKYLVYAIILIIMMIISSSPSLAPLREKLNWSYLYRKLFSKKKDESKEEK
jgi:branched-chain amino acid transport system permease protein